MTTITSHTKQSTVTLNLTTLTHSGHLFQNSTKQSNGGFRWSRPPEITDTCITKTVTFQGHFLRKTHDLLFPFGMLVDNFFYNETKQKPCHYIPNIIQYYITFNLTDDIHLQLGVFLKLG